MFDPFRLEQLARDRHADALAAAERNQLFREARKATAGRKGVAVRPAAWSERWRAWQAASRVIQPLIDLTRALTPAFRHLAWRSPYPTAGGPDNPGATSAITSRSVTNGSSPPDSKVSLVTDARCG